ncbi:hypothetical protein BVG93_05560 [Serratia marcescens]|nr:hypothetical protein SERRSCBI_08350 [Serratia sp. SCBI]ASM11435.1 hypothetical protein BVG93_05560 [Serratia marcescens]
MLVMLEDLEGQENNRMQKNRYRTDAGIEGGRLSGCLLLWPLRVSIGQRAVGEDISMSGDEIRSTQRLHIAQQCIFAIGPNPL